MLTTMKAKKHPGPAPNTAQERGLRVKALRKHYGLSQGQFAEKLGLKSYQAVSNIEAGKSDMEGATLETMISRFGTTREWLLHGEGTMLPNGMADIKTEPDPWKDEAWTLARQQLNQKDEQLNTVTRALDRVTLFLNKLDPSIFLHPVRETGS